MNYPNRHKTTFLAADLIEEQLGVLMLSVPAISHVFESGERWREHARAPFPRRLRLVKTASGGNIVAAKADHPDKAPPVHILSGGGQMAAQGRNDCHRVVVGNCLVTVGTFMRRHNMLDMRTPEFQFLGHVMEAVLNANTFHLPSGYMPTASFDGLVIEGALHGTPLFAEGTLPGFLEIGDAVALLQWLHRYLRGEHGYVSDGDAG